MNLQININFASISQRRVVTAILESKMPALDIGGFEQLMDMFKRPDMSAFSNLHQLLTNGVYKPQHVDAYRKFLRELAEYAEREGRLDNLLFDYQLPF